MSCICTLRNYDSCLDHVLSVYIYIPCLKKKTRRAPLSPKEKTTTTKYFALLCTAANRMRSNTRWTSSVYINLHHKKRMRFVRQSALPSSFGDVKGPYEKTVYETRRREESDFSHEPECRLVQFFQHHASSLDLFAYTIHTDRTDCAKFELIYITYIYSIDTVI